MDWPQIVIAAAAVGALLTSIYNSTRIKQVHLLINSRLTELIDLTRISSLAEGLKQGREERKD
jgi:hypothetical protein